MRDIKFRAWNEVLEKMYSWNEFLNTNMKQTFIASESTAMILMQYTGIKDKNGKEIYEGDIVKVKNVDYHIGKIIYDEEYAEYEINCKYAIFPISLCYGDFNDLDIEIIGNIYENPELLKGEQS